MTSNYISESLRKLVIERAKGCCEYCLINQNFSIYSHEVDHIIAIKHGGKTTADNLALACLSCNRHKGSDFATLDQNTGEIVPLFNPRCQTWIEHFSLNGGEILGITQIGEATARLLMFNIPTRIQTRKLLIAQNLFFVI